MSFRNRLKALKERELEAKKRQAEEERKRREEELRKYYEHVRRLERVKKQFRELEDLARREILPMLELVDSVYLEGAGTISVGVNWRPLLSTSVEDYLSRLSDAEEVPRIHLALSWGKESRTIEARTDYAVVGYKIEVKGYALGVRLDNDGNILLRAGNRWTSMKKVDLKNRHWPKTLQDGIYSLLEYPERCRCSDSWSHGR